MYRAFRNGDPPGLVDVWNEAFTGRGAVVLRHGSTLERHAFAKPYFDPAGLIVAVEDDRLVGFCHAGFGPGEPAPGAGGGLGTARGTTCLIGVRSSRQRQGIGAELLRRSEEYLRSRGALTLFAGSMHPVNPFYFGIYGGSDSPGFLESDTAASGFLRARGYEPAETRLIFQRRLDQAIRAADPRFAGLRRRFQIKIQPRMGVASWWRECVLGATESYEFQLEELGTSQALAKAELWEMEGFSWRWGLPSVGILGLEVREGSRGQGLGRFLLANVLQYLQDQYFGIVEAQAPPADAAAVALLQGLGFTQVDLGHLFRRK